MAFSNGCGDALRRATLAASSDRSGSCPTSMTRLLPADAREATSQPRPRPARRELPPHLDVALAVAELRDQRDDLGGLHRAHERAGDDLKGLLVELEQELRDAAHPVPPGRGERAVAVHAAVGLLFSGAVAHHVELQSAPILAITWIGSLRFATALVDVCPLSRFARACGSGRCLSALSLRSSVGLGRDATSVRGFGTGPGLLERLVIGGQRVRRRAVLRAPLPRRRRA